MIKKLKNDEQWQIYQQRKKTFMKREKESKEAKNKDATKGSLGEI